MYTEDYKREDFPYKNFLLKFIIIIIVVAILVCIVTAISKKNQNIEPEGYTDEIFSENLEKMKEHAIKYYNENNIPNEVGESSKLTLEKMISLKAITPIKDKDNKLCDNKKSYVKLTKKDKEYQLKVNLFCSGEEDYITAHLNNNSYCKDTYLCEIKSETIDNEKDKNEEESTDIEESNIENNFSNSIIKSSKSKKTTTTKKKKVRKTKVTSKTQKGTIKVKNTTDNYIYEYIKTSNVVFSDWSLWSNWVTVDCNTSAITCNNNDKTCLKELKRLDRKEKLNKYNTYKSQKTSLINNANITTGACTNYNYIKVDGIIYQLASSTDYKQVNNINKNTRKNVGSWIYNGRASYDVPPTDTYNTHYVLVDADYSNCGNTCTKSPKYIYDKYTYGKTITRVSSYICNKNKSQTIPIYNKKMILQIWKK